MNESFRGSNSFLRCTISRINHRNGKSTFLVDTHIEFSKNICRFILYYFRNTIFQLNQERQRFSLSYLDVCVLLCPHLSPKQISKECEIFGLKIWGESKLHSYKIRLVEELSAYGYDTCTQVADKIMEKWQHDQTFFK